MMKVVTILALLAGLAVATLLVAHFGFDAVVHAVETLHWGGFAEIVLFQLLLICLMGTGWRMLGARDGLEGASKFIWGRVIRDSASETLPLSQVGGFVLGARAATLAGVPPALAAASTIVDITSEVVAQLAYTFLGLGLLVWLEPSASIVRPALAGLAVMTVAVLIFGVVQVRGVGLIEKFGIKLAQQHLGARVANDGAVLAQMRAIHARPKAFALAVLIHLVCWVLAGLQGWVTLRLMGVHLGVAQALVIDSLLYGMRSIAFMVPNSLGVQEGGYILLGALFGLRPEYALALSLIRRGRDLFIGVPALLAWQVAEGNRAWAAAPEEPTGEVKAER